MAFSGFPMSVDPRSTQVFGLLQNGNAFTNPLSGSFNQTSTLMGSIRTLTAQHAQAGTIDPVTQQEITEVMDRVDSSVLDPQPSDGVPSLFQHTQDAINDLPNRLSMAKNMIRTNETLEPSLDPCAFIGNLFGSILDVGTGLMEDVINIMSDLLNKLVNIISEGIGVISELLNRLLDKVSEIVNLVLDEIANLLNGSGILDLFGQALNLLNLLGDPCSLIVMASASTPELKAVTEVPPFENGPGDRIAF